MTPRTTILGGSTPFTAALVEALRAADAALPAGELCLFGRDRSFLEAMKRYATARLAPIGWMVSASDLLEEAVDGAAVVVNQIRFGGLQGRARDESLARQFDLPADETLGPSALSAALRIVPPLTALARELGRRCPDAWVLNLANPLSVTTAAMIQAGAPRKCVGLCELPFTTVAETCRLLGVPVDTVEWRYAGFNHRGFVFALALPDRDLLAQLPELLGGRTVFGVTAEDIARVGAIPLKYFRLCAASPEGTAVHRAEFLLNLKQSVYDELQASDQPPPSLSKRDLRWYECAVVPMIVAIFAGDGRELIVNQTRDDGLVWELPARVFREGLQPVAATPGGRVGEWLTRFAAHERALLEAIESPSLSRIEQALELDPCVPGDRVREIARAVHSGLQMN